MKIKNDEDKKVKGTKKCVIKRKRKFLAYKNCLEAAPIENKKNHLEKKLMQIVIKNSKKKKKKKLKAQQRFKIERQNVFTEEISKIDLSSDDDKRVQSIDLIEAYVHGTSKDLLWKKEETKCSNIIKTIQ